MTEPMSEERLAELKSKNWAMMGELETRELTNEVTRLREQVEDWQDVNATTQKLVAKANVVHVSLRDQLQAANAVVNHCDTSPERQYGEWMDELGRLIAAYQATQKGGG